METEGVMVVTTAQIPTNLETLSSPCEGSLQQGDYITSINGNPVNSKEELVSSVEACAGQPYFSLQSLQHYEMNRDVHSKLLWLWQIELPQPFVF